MSFPGPGTGLASYETSRIKHAYHPDQPGYSIKREPSQSEYPLTNNRNPDFQPLNKRASIKREGADVVRYEYPYYPSKSSAAELAEAEEAEEAATYAAAVGAPRGRSSFAGPAPADYVHLNYPSVIYGSPPLAPPP